MAGQVSHSASVFQANRVVSTFSTFIKVKKQAIIFTDGLFLLPEFLR